MRTVSRGPFGLLPSLHLIEPAPDSPKSWPASHRTSVQFQHYVNSGNSIIARESRHAPHEENASAQFASSSVCGSIRR